MNIIVLASKVKSFARCRQPQSKLGTDVMSCGLIMECAQELSGGRACYHGYHGHRSIGDRDREVAVRKEEQIHFQEKVFSLSRAMSKSESFVRNYLVCLWRLSVYLCTIPFSSYAEAQ